MAQAVEDAQRALRQLEYLFRAEEDNIRRTLEARRNELMGDARPAAATELRARLDAEGTSSASRLAFDLAQTIARQRLEQWARSIQPEAEDLYRVATSRFVALGNHFLQRLVATGDQAFHALPRQLEPETGFRTVSHFFFTDMLTLSEPAAGAGVLEALRTREQSIRAAYKRALPYLDRLLDTNSARMTNDLVDRVRESGARLRSELATTLRGLTSTAERAIERARESLKAGDAGVQRELARLADLTGRLRAGEDVAVPRAI
jgi:hypothetical protein